MSIHERLKIIREKMEAAQKRSKHPPEHVTLMGASKGQSLNSIRSATELGVLDMGENYAQDLIAKAPLCLDTKVRWHFIGRLQSNKIKHIIPYVTSIGSVDSLELAEKIMRIRESLDAARPPVPILLQVNLGNERQKAGLPPQIIESLFDSFLEMSGIRVAGLMCIPPQSKDAEKTRVHYRAMKELFDRLKPRHRNSKDWQVLSMGMSADYEVAIEEGSNCIRIGEALFGPRPSE